MKPMKRTAWIAMYQEDFEPGHAPSDSTIKRMLNNGEIEGVTQRKIRGQWYVEDVKSTADDIVQEILRKRHAA